MDFSEDDFDIDLDKAPPQREHRVASPRHKRETKKKIDSWDFESRERTLVAPAESKTEDPQAKSPEKRSTKANKSSGALTVRKPRFDSGNGDCPEFELEDETYEISREVLPRHNRGIKSLEDREPAPVSNPLPSQYGDELRNRSDRNSIVRVLRNDLYLL